MTHDEFQGQVTLDGEPASKARPRLGKGRVYTPTGTASAEELWRWTLRSVVSKPVDDSAFAVKLRFYSGVWTRKDIDNMIKLVLDACNGVVWADDRQVVGIDAWLYRGDDHPRTELTVTMVDQPLAPTVACGHCGKVVPSYATRQRDGTSRRRRFCSTECAWASKREARTCPTCNQEFEVRRSSSSQRFCSRSCAGTAGGSASSVSSEQLRRAVDMMTAGVSQAAAAEAVGVKSAALARAIVAAGRR